MEDVFCEDEKIIAKNEAEHHHENVLQALRIIGYVNRRDSLMDWKLRRRNRKHFLAKNISKGLNKE